MSTSTILQKFGISELNPMQEDAGAAIQSGADVVLLSPTGTGKTLAFLLPLIAALDLESDEIQALILVPTRELAQQIDQVARNMGSGFKINAVYGGRAGSLDKLDLKHRPAILIGTPGRVADRLRRDNFSVRHIKHLILDEFDKSLEIGFENEMEEIIESLPNVQQRILTSATREAIVPKFVGLQQPAYLNYLGEGGDNLTIETILSPDKDKLQALGQVLAHIGPQPGMVFCNFKDGLARVSDFLTERNVAHETFHGNMEQGDRERALIKFRNGTSQLLLATDLAARGLDIPELAFILHYHLPPRKKEFTHRNGRTARMHSTGVAYLLAWEEEALPDYIQEMQLPRVPLKALAPSSESADTDWTTVYLTGGRRDKISKGDIVGLFLKQGGLSKDQLGIIEIQQSTSYAAVHTDAVDTLVAKTNNTRLKKKKVRINVV